MIYGYVRVSTRKQVDGDGLEVQRNDILSKYPTALIFDEQYTGTKVDRPIFKKLIESLTTGDILVVSKLDRCARNTVEGIKVVEQLNNQVRSHGNNVLCGRVICADCGSIYGPKVWYSNDIYRHVVWQCNNKFNGNKCTTPTLDEETIKNAYLKALNILLKDKELLISNLLLVKEKLLDVNLSKPMEQAKNEMLVVSGLCEQHIFNKEKKQMKFKAYMEEYVDLVKRFTEA